MKKSELTAEIKNYIYETLSENEAYELTGATGNKTVASFKDSNEANKFKTQNPNVRNIKKLEETEEMEDDAEPTASDIAANASVAKLQSKYGEVVKQMKSVVNKYKSAEGAEKQKYVDQLKGLTKLKKEIEAMINPSMDDEEQD